MNRKSIVKAEALNREIYSFLTGVRADMPVDWMGNLLDLVRGAIIEVYVKT